MKQKSKVNKIAPQQLTNAQQQQSNAQQPQLSNAQQQQFNAQQPQLSNAQQQQFNAQIPVQMQYPIQQQMQYPVQQQMQYPVQQQMPFPGQMQMSNVAPQRTVGYYGLGSRNLQPPAEEPAIFNDDQPLIEVKESVKGGEGKVEITIKAQRSQVKLGEATVLPAMASVVASGGTRTSVDLVCVIDVSGSMGG